MTRQQLLEGFASWLQEKLDKLEISPADLARLSKVKDSTISRMLAAKTRPLPETLEKIAPIINESVEELLIRSGYPFSPKKENKFDNEDDDLFKDANVRLVARAYKDMPDNKKDLFKQLILSMSEEAKNDTNKTR